MGSPLGPLAANAFLDYPEQNWLNSCQLEYRPLYYLQYISNIFVLFKSPGHLSSCHPICHSL